jgi:lycopene cyclase domain-containing protein
MEGSSLTLWYLASLLISIAGLTALDFRSKLAFFSAPLRATITMVIGVVFFLLWDVAGIALGIFFRGDSPFLSGWQLAPELPIEELFFLIVLCYSTLLVFLAARNRLARK